MWYLSLHFLDQAGYEAMMENRVTSDFSHACSCTKQGCVAHFLRFKEPGDIKEKCCSVTKTLWAEINICSLPKSGCSGLLKISDVARHLQIPLECHLHVLSKLPTESISSPFLKVTQNEGPAVFCVQNHLHTQKNFQMCIGISKRWSVLGYHCAVRSICGAV